MFRAISSPLDLEFPDTTVIEPLSEAKCLNSSFSLLSCIKAQECLEFKRPPLYVVSFS